MKRIVVASLLALVALVAVAAPALAQKDPFDPVTGGSGTSTTDTSGDDPFDPATGTGVTTTGTTTGSTDGNGTVSGSDTPVQPESLPNTGADTISWAALAYMLIAVGGAFVLLGRVHAPIRRR